MAVTPNSNIAFLREVDEEVRRDQIISFWRRWGVGIAVIIVVAAIALGAVTWWKTHQHAVAGRQGEQMQQAFDDLGAGKQADADKALAALAASKGDGYRVLARFTQADVLLQKKDLKGAAAQFAAIAADQAVARPFRDLALIRQTSAEYDTMQPQAVIDRLRPLTINGSPWFGTAGEMTAIAYMKLGKRDIAGRMFGQIAAADGVPDTIRQRAVQMAGVLGVDAVGTTKEKSSQ